VTADMPAGMDEAVEIVAERMYLQLMQETRDEWPHFNVLPKQARANWRDEARKTLAAALPALTAEVERLRDESTFKGQLLDERTAERDAARDAVDRVRALARRNKGGGPCIASWQLTAALDGADQ
jgi:hypothetical protein